MRTMMGRIENILKLCTDSSAKGGSLTDTRDLNKQIYARYMIIEIFEMKDKGKIL